MRWDTGTTDDSLAAWLFEVTLSATCTYFPMPESKKWTHTLCGNRRQIELLCACPRAKGLMQFSGARDSIGAGVDHRAVVLELTIPTKQCRHGKGKCKAKRRFQSQSGHDAKVNADPRSRIECLEKAGTTLSFTLMCEDFEDCRSQAVQENVEGGATKREPRKATTLTFCS